MKVVGFTIVRNALQFDYPVAASILSILPLCDELVVAVGQSEDDTLGLIQGIESTKIRIIETVWDDSLRTGGQVLAKETDKSFQTIAKDADWAFYIQADEVVHEKYHPAIKKAMKENLANKEIDGLLFNYLHFYGSYDYVADSYDWYRREVRIVRKNEEIYSYRDAQGFRKGNNQKLKVKLIDAYVYHYGWVKDPRAMQRKQKSFNKYWHDDEWVDRNVASAAAFDYSKISLLHLFDGTHPAVMQERINEKNWRFDHDIATNKYPLKLRLKRWMEKWTGYRPGEYKNYEEQ